jgi:zinc protease
MEPSSKFQKDLVDSGACVRANLTWFTQMNTGPITLAFEAAPDKADACVQAIMTELTRLKDPALASDAELQNGAHVIEIGIVKEREKPSDFAHTLTFWWTSAGLDYYDHYVENLKKVKHDDVVKYVDRFFTGKPFVFAAMVSPEMSKKGLDRAHWEKLVLKGAK